MMNFIRRNSPKMERLLVISASRRTDLVGCYPEILVERLKKFPPEEVHSLVIWTKNPKNMIEEGPLKKTLRKYRQIYVHLTITGMGGGEFEPLIPPSKEVVELIGPLIDLVGSPRRISWRFDPILEVEGHGRNYTNFGLFGSLAKAMAPLGVESCRVSWVSPYKKVLSRLSRKGWDLASGTLRERLEQGNVLKQIAREHGMSVYFCSMGEFPVSRCIDGELLRKIHPLGLNCSQEKAKGQRLHCGCTQSLDIGWYSLRCQHGCLYCYAS